MQIRIHDDGGTVHHAYSFSVLDPDSLPPESSLIAHWGPDGRLVYTPDYRGNRIPDFSSVGYRGGEEIPAVPTVLSLSPVPGDYTDHIQAAIDRVSSMEPNERGFQGRGPPEKGDI